VLSPSDRLKFLRTELARTSALYSPTHPDVLRYQREIAGLEKDIGAVDHSNDIDRQVQDATSQLASAKERYGAEHPDVQRLERMFAALKVQQTEARSAPAVPRNAPANPDNPAYVQVMAQRDAGNSERTSLQTKRTDLEKRIHEMERRLESAPGVEREYTALLRESENAQLKYREVRQKQMEAEVSQNLEAERKGERFTLIEPPSVPGEPASPNRLLIVVLGVVLALGAGVGMALLLEVLDTSVRNKRELEQLLQVPPLAVLPWITTQAELATRARRRMFGIGGAVGALILTVIGVHLLYRPLDVLWEVTLRRLG
jgi:capsule polysaccharide export protein KpsE/RkpR